MAERSQVSRTQVNRTKARRKTVKKKASATSASKKAPAKKTAVKKAPAKRAVAKAVGKAVVKPAVEKSPLLKVVEAALADMKAVNVMMFDVRGVTDVADNMVIASGTSDRHVKAIADSVVQAVKKAGFRPMGVEGEREGEWTLVDLQDVIVHVMLPRVREFYRLEDLWDVSAARREAAQG